MAAHTGSSDPQDQSATNNLPADNPNQAVMLIRAKIDTLYANEPSAKEEAQEAEVVQPRSKHQQFMHELSTSGKSLAEIQTAWHNYYIGLPDGEKHEVWREFYAKHSKLTGTPPPKLNQSSDQSTEPDPKTEHTPRHRPTHDTSKPQPAAFGTIAEIKNQLLHKVSKRVKLSKKRQQQFKSLAFGLGMGTLVLVILLFGFFNERFIAPFITPSRQISSTPIITDLTSTESIPTNPVVIVPKINIEIPVVYDEPSIDEAAVQRALERGVLHYPTTANPGELGNAVFFGHSSSNILNNGKYKFAFVLLNRLENGDTFMIQKDGKRYMYRVFEKRVVPPTDISVLNNRDRPAATATLITCDPPGTDVNRLIVVGEQISPDPGTNVASSLPPQDIATPETLPSEAPTLWGRFWGWLSS